MKKLLSIILALMMALPLLGNACAPVFAAGAEGPAAVQAIPADPLSDDGGEGGGDDDVYAEAYGDKPLLTIGEETAVSYDGTEASGVFRFIPEEDGKYTFFSSGTIDTYASFYSASGYQFTSNDDGGENGNFCFTVNLIGGETYYLFSRLYSSGSSGTYSVTVKRIIPVKSISLSLSDPSAKLTQGVDSGYWTYYYDYEAGVRIDYYYFNAEAVLGIITVNAVFEDGSEGVINLSDGSYYYEFSYESSEWIAGGDANTFTLTVEGCAATINVPVASYGDQFGELRDLVLDEEIEVNYDGTPESGLFRFIPERDGKYVFTSTGGYDTYCLLRDFKGSQIASNDDGGENGNFRLEYRL